MDYPAVHAWDRDIPALNAMGCHGFQGGGQSKIRYPGLLSQQDSVYGFNGCSIIRKYMV